MRTLLEEIASLAQDGSLWNRGPAIVVGSVQDASVQCLSVLPHPQAPNDRLRCAVDHTELGTAVHGAMVGSHYKTWTTVEAAKAWAAVHRCAANCGVQVPEGVTYCSVSCQLADKHTFDEYETEAAA